MTALATLKRQAVATAVGTGLASLEGGWTAYASPVDSVSLPAAVLGPGEPYREPLTFGDFGTAGERMRLTLHLLAKRATGNTALDAFDEAQDAVFAALEDVTYPTRWATTRVTGEVEVSGEAALGAQIDIEVL